MVKVVRINVPLWERANAAALRTGLTVTEFVELILEKRLAELGPSIQRPLVRAPRRDKATP
jgi:hypothetical protein